MGARISALPLARCCHEDELSRFNAELQFPSDGSQMFGVDLNNEHGSMSGRLDPSDGVAQIHALHCNGVGEPWAVPCHGGPMEPSERFGCCKTNSEFGAEVSMATSMAAQPMESLSYTPVRFDESTTIDVERSHARYSKIVVHSTRARTQRRSKAWEDWLRGATTGRGITLLVGLDEASEGETPAVLKKIPAMYHLDRALTKLSILPANGVDIPAITILVDNIQVICPATDFMLFFDQVDEKLDASEKGRAVLLQYVTEDTERKGVCFLEESEPAKDRFVQALTALWLEKRNDHSMWF